MKRESKWNEGERKGEKNQLEECKKKMNLSVWIMMKKVEVWITSKGSNKSEREGKNRIMVRS